MVLKRQHELLMHGGIETTIDTDGHYLAVTGF
jgi:hypothetical protein